MPHARIFQKPKNAMQSGRSGTDRWMLEFQPTEAKKPDPLTGWAGSGDTRGQISLSFPTLEAAKAYADKYGITAAVIPATAKILKLQTYADNFR
jgi:ETC complex I subunit conserved region